MIIRFVKCGFVISLSLLVQLSCLLANNYNDTVPYSALLLSEYIQYESVTGNEKPAGEFFAGVAEKKGLIVEVFTDEIDSYNFAASLYPLSLNKPNIIFLNHIDVVEAENGDLNKYPPFSGTIAEGKVWGRGAIDNKGHAVMQLLAISEFVELAAENDLPYNITMLSVSGEETGGAKGAKIITNEYLDVLNPVVVYGEGGIGLPGLLHNKPDKKVFGISVAAKRSLWLELTLDMNISGHGSVPPVDYTLKEKVKSLERVVKRNQRRIVRLTDPALDMFYKIGQLEGGIRGMLLRNIRLFRPIVIPQMKKDEIVYALISNTVTITGFSAQPGPPNIIPNRTKAVLDCRLLPETSTEEFIEKIKKWLNNDQIEIEILHEGLDAPATKPEKFYYLMEEALKEYYPSAAVISILSPASYDNTYFRAKGIPAYGMLPIFLNIDHLSSIHNVNERMPIDFLEKGVDVHRVLLSILFKDFLE